MNTGLGFTEPLDPHACDLRRGAVRAVELFVGDIVSGAVELGNEEAATVIDRKDLVLAAVGDKDAGIAFLTGRSDEAGGEGEDVGEEVAVGDANREGVRGAVGEAFGGDAGAVDREAGKGVGQRLVDEGDVRTIATGEDVPGAKAGVGGQQDQAELVCELHEGFDRPAAIAGGAVQHQDERCGTRGIVVRWDVPNTVPLGIQAKRVEAGHCRLGLMFSWPGVEPALSVGDRVEVQGFVVGHTWT